MENRGPPSESPTGEPPSKKTRDEEPRGLSRMLGELIMALERPTEPPNVDAATRIQQRPAAPSPEMKPVRQPRRGEQVSYKHQIDAARAVRDSKQKARAAQEAQREGVMPDAPQQNVEAVRQQLSQEDVATVENRIKELEAQDYAGAQPRPHLFPPLNRLAEAFNPNASDEDDEDGFDAEECQPAQTVEPAEADRALPFLMELIRLRGIDAEEQSATPGGAESNPSIDHSIAIRYTLPIEEDGAQENGLETRLKAVVERRRRLEADLIEAFREEHELKSRLKEKTLKRTFQMMEHSYKDSDD